MQFWIDSTLRKRIQVVFIRPNVRIAIPGPAVGCEPVAESRGRFYNRNSVKTVQASASSLSEPLVFEQALGKVQFVHLTQYYCCPGWMPYFLWKVVRTECMNKVGGRM